MGLVFRTPEQERAVYIRCDNLSRDTLNELSSDNPHEQRKPVLIGGTTAYNLGGTIEVGWPEDKVMKLPNDYLLFDAIVQRHHTENLLVAFYDPRAAGYSHIEPLTFHQSYFHPFFDFAKTSDIYQFPGHFVRPAAVAIFTQVYNENTMLRIWDRYYSKIVDPQHLYVIDHGSTTDPRTLVSPNVNVVTVPRGETDHRNIAHFCNHFHRFLLSHYRWVIHVDVDEILVHRRGFKTYIEELGTAEDQKIISAADAYNIVHSVDHEPALDLDRPITLQRSYIVPDEHEKKPVIASVPATWGMGFHFVMEKTQDAVDDDLWVMHLPYMDRDLITAKNAKWNAMKFSKDCETYGPHTVTPTENEAVVKMLAEKLAEAGTTTIPDWVKGTF